MIVDTSAIIALLRNEPEARLFAQQLESAKRVYMASPNVLELCMVMLSTKAPQGLAKIKQTLRELNVTVLPFTEDMADHAVLAFLQYGKGRGHAAQLNFGDCIAYAAAKCESMPLLFKGNDFRMTDVECAV